MTTINVLDHGYVKLIDTMGNDETIIEAARMSTGKGFQGWGPKEDGKPGDEKLLAFLWENQHTTPFEMCELALEVQAPIMVFREWHRHRTQSYNEFSARYEKMPDLHYLPAPERVQKQSTSNKQGSAEPMQGANSYRAGWEKEQKMVFDAYEQAIEDGMAKEVARLNCPVSRYSKMRVKANLLNWFRFLGLRMAPNAQWEIRQYANAVASIVKSWCPRSYALFEEHTLYGVRLSRSQVAALIPPPTGAMNDAEKAVWKKLQRATEL